MCPVNFIVGLEVKIGKLSNISNDFVIDTWSPRMGPLYVIIRKEHKFFT